MWTENERTGMTEGARSQGIAVYFRLQVLVTSTWIVSPFWLQQASPRLTYYRRNQYDSIQLDDSL